MFKILSIQEETFGLDINDLSLKIVKLEKHGKGFVLASYNDAKIGKSVIDGGVIKDEDALAKIIKSAYNSAKGKKINTKYVAASLPEEKSFLQVVQMPLMTEEELKIAVPLEAENYIPLPIEDVYLDFQVIPPVKDYFNNLDVVLAAMPKKIIDSYVSCIKKAGFFPVILEPESQAIARAVVKKGASSSMSVIIDFGENNTDFIIFSGLSTRFTCSIPISSRLLTDAIAEFLKLSFEEAEKIKIEEGLSNEKIFKIVKPILSDLSSQIKKYLDFYKDHSSFEYLLPDGKSEKILLCGGGAALKELPKFLSEKLGAEVEVGDPLVNFLHKNSETIIKKNLTSYTTAIGLALRDANNDKPSAA